MLKTWCVAGMWFTVGLGACAASTQQLPQPGWVWGAVYSAADGAAVAEAQVYIPELNIGSLTDRRGRFVIREVPAGTWTLQVARACYVTTDVQIEAKPDGLQIDSILVAHTGQARAGPFLWCRVPRDGSANTASSVR